ELVGININELQTELITKENKLSKTKQDLAKVELSIYSLENNKDLLSENSKKLVVELEELDNEIVEIESKIKHLNILVDEKNENFFLLKEELISAETGFKAK